MHYLLDGTSNEKYVVELEAVRAAAAINTDTLDSNSNHNSKGGDQLNEAKLPFRQLLTDNSGQPYKQHGDNRKLVH